MDIISNRTYANLMRMIWLVFSIILTSCASYEKVQDKDLVVLPRAKNVSLSEKTIHPNFVKSTDSEIRVGFIERGKIQSFDQFKEFKNVTFIQTGDDVIPTYVRDFKGNLSEIESPTPYQYETHAEAVLFTFLKSLHTSKKVTIYSCSLGTSRDRELAPEEKCWNWMKENNVQAINISYEVLYLTRSEKQTILSLISNQVVITNAAGNDAEIAAGLCTFDNIYCVGALMDNKPAKYSNFGPLINVWEDGDVQWKGHLVRGTSISAPRYLGKKLSD